MRDAAAIAVLCAALAFAALTRGAYHDHERALALLLVLVPGALVAARWRLPRIGVVGTAAIAMAGSALLSAWAAGNAVEARPAIALLAACAVVASLARGLDDAARSQLAGALVWLGAAVGLYGWAAVVFRWYPYALIDQGLWRSATTLTYANAAAALLVPLLLVSLARPTPWVARYALLVSIGATQSRGGVVALALGLLVLARLHGWRPTISALGAPAAGAAVALAALAPTAPAFSAPTKGLAVAGLAAGVVVAALVRRLDPRVLAVVGLLVAVVGVARVPDVTTARASLASQDRVDEAVAALRVAQAHPVIGAGPVEAFRYVAGDGRGRMRAKYAHNEYLQLAAEQGAVGVLVLLAGAVAIVRSVRRSQATALWAGAVAGLAAFAAHSALDFLWHIPVLPLLAAVLVGLSLPRKEPS